MKCTKRFNVWVFNQVIYLCFIRELEGATPFTRKIHIDELWLYKNPRIDSYVPTSLLWPLIFLTPALVIFLVFILRRDKDDACKGLLSLTLALFLTGVITNIVKIIVGESKAANTYILIILKFTFLDL
jgi:diacylglycerol diphosphate phosphatase / phosphatidate phosphatase